MVLPLEPYSGDDLQRVNLIGTAHSHEGWGPDPTGAVTYSFNTLGYRGPEFDGKGKKIVFAFGESHAFGTGVEFEQIWTSRFVARWADKVGLTRDEVSFLSFAEHGASNDYIARTVLSQCTRLKPELILVNFAEPDRVEGCADSLFKVGPWILDPSAAAQIRSVERGSPLRRMLVDRRRRTKAFYEFYADGFGILNMLKNILLVQLFARVHGIRAIATCNRFTALDLSDPAFAPLLGQIDAAFLSRTTFDNVDPRPGFRPDDHHPPPRTHDLMAEAMLAFLEREPWDPSNHGAAVATPERAAGVARSVRSFYDEMPFNLHRSAGKAARSIRANSISSMYPDLARLLSSGTVVNVIEFGCGAGWLANTIAHEYPSVSVTAVDFSSTALRRARKVTRKLRLTDRVRFVESNLFECRPGIYYELVLSIGVLHHTHDAKAALDHILQFAGRPGFAYIGLYHEYARRAFLRVFRDLVRQHGERAALRRYRSLDAVRATDRTHLRSWFRDQVLHPHETQHTLEEVLPWLHGSGFELRSTSINRFEEISDLNSLYVEERRAERVSTRAIQEENRYLPGFFTVLAERI